MRYVALGDSITAYRVGVKVYFEHLQEAARELSLTDMVNSGVGGWTTADVLQNLEDKCLKYRPNLVTVMLGTNDHAIYINQTKPKIQLDQYARNLREIVRRIHSASYGEGSSAASPHVILMTPPYVCTYTNRSGTESNQSRLLAYCHMVKEVSVQLGTGFVDINAITASETKDDDQLFSISFTVDNDGVHLNSLGHRILLPLIKMAIQSSH